MAVFSKEFADEALKRLKAKNALGPCPRCTEEKFQMLEGFVTPPVVLNTKITISLQKTMPSVVLICKNCGFSSFHSIGLLKMMNWGDAVENKE